ncbi:MAG TPA: hypothetical protein VLU43_15085 [Anaeromyxobacteraceae bacterium]|nr:hypothetical protein [Anaeromyxobacteraceae bacterium]
MRFPRPFPGALALVLALPSAALPRQAPAGSAASPTAGPAPVASPAALAVPAAPAVTEAPADFSADARLLFDVVTCPDGAALPPKLDAGTWRAYCKRQKKAMAKYRDEYLPKASAFLAKLRPADLPTTVVYPFGGGDLLSALTTYPDARDVTTLSLEHAGDPRRLGNIADAAALEESLETIRSTSSGLLYANDSKTENLMKGQRGEIPGQLAFFMIGLAVHGYEPVSLRFFRIERDGSLHYLTASEIREADEKGTARLLRGQWTAPDFSPAFSNSEIVFVRKGADPAAAARVHRHIAADLSDPAVAKHPGVLRFLQSKGRVAAMTKAASYLLWRDDFSRVRDYLIAQMDFMISDSTGIPPQYLAKTGLVQETYGRFEKSFLEASEAHNQAFVELWSSQPRRKMPIRYGYIDGSADNNVHLLVTRKAPVKM